ncbi:YesL family protein [Aquibacillus rhizosphaerae]|uniref:DUF624 domain-containing protein n=1 Tax=Aquibacillus rhizosphaerae TaxID=3051431 RepID=A0ABT7LBV8_9BACI|nr:DUF624 domain-containing protein [Aquibacillus sp. LR5S19]MDL4842065.1 DUF624 domain-containing protein [Aquibacillus sp. LR5S19]
MHLGTFSGGIFSFCNWIYRLAYLNILWIGFTLLGGVVFGIFPSSVALLSVLRQFIQKKEPIIFSTFWSYYKKEFKNSNKIGVIIGIIGFLIVFNLNFLHQNPINQAQWLIYPMIITGYMYLLFICYLLASFITFEQTLRRHIKNSILIMFFNPLPSFFMIFGFAAVYYALTWIPGIGFFFSASLLGLVILSSATLAYQKIEKKQLQLSNQVTNESIS